MKKLLIASTALVAAGLMTTGTASASEKIKLNVGGFSKWWVVGAWQDSDYESNAQPGGAAISPTNVDVKGDNEVHFTGSTTLDNGLKVGVRMELEAGGHTDQASDTIDESYAFIESGFGKVLVGTHNNGTYLLHVNAPDAAGNWNESGIMTGDWTIARPAAVSGMTGNANTTAIATDSDADKITYVAPSFYGLTVGGSYIPNAAVQDNRNVGNAATVAGGSDASAYGVGALYANTFGGFGVKVSGGWVTYQLAGEGENTNEWSTGTQLSFAGFTLGGSYRALESGSNAGGVGTYANDGRAFDVGLQYATGPFAVSLAYFNSEVNGSFGGDDDQIEFYQLSGKYTLGAGVDVLASAGYAKYEDEVSVAGANAANNEGYTVMTGLSLAF